MSSAALASSIPPPPPPPPLAVVPYMLVERRRLELSALNVTARLVGPLVETTVAAVFFNAPQALRRGDSGGGREEAETAEEGRLVLPLPAHGATVCHYAASVDGRMVDAVPVERSAARQAYERETLLRRARGRTSERDADRAALAALAEGNVFVASVQPVWPNGTATVRVTYVSRLERRPAAATAAGEAGGFVLRMHLGDADRRGRRPVPEFNLELSVADDRVNASSLPRPRQAGRLGPLLRFGPPRRRRTVPLGGGDGAGDGAGDAYVDEDGTSSTCVARASLRNEVLSDTLEVDLPHLDGAWREGEPVALVEERDRAGEGAQNRHRSGTGPAGASRGPDHYFAVFHDPSRAAAEVLSELMAGAPGQGPPSPPPGGNGGASHDGGAALRRAVVAGAPETAGDPPTPPPLPAAAGPPRTARVRVYWDCSLSRENADKAPSFALLEAVTDAVTADGRTDLVVEVVLVRDDAQLTHEAQVTRQSGAGALLNYLRDVVYDGGTSLAVVVAAELAAGAAAAAGTAGGPSKDAHDLALLFHDGMANLHLASESLPVRSDGYWRPVHCVVDTAASNGPLLARVAAMSGGSVFRVEGGAGPPPAVAALAVLRPRPRLVSVESAPPGAVTHLHPRMPQQLDGSAGVWAVGRLAGASATLTFNYGVGRKVMRSVSVRLRREDAMPGLTVSRFWAQERVAELGVFPKLNRQHLLELGRHHGIVTPFTSLVVLATLGQHLANRVRPPASRPEMRREYDLRIRETDAERAAAATDKAGLVRRQWAELIHWWKTPFDAAPFASNGAALRELAEEEDDDEDEGTEAEEEEKKRGSGSSSSSSSSGGGSKDSRSATPLERGAAQGERDAAGSGEGDGTADEDEESSEQSGGAVQRFREKVVQTASAIMSKVRRARRGSPVQHEAVDVEAAAVMSRDFSSSSSPSSSPSAFSSPLQSRRAAAHVPASVAAAGGPTPILRHKAAETSAAGKPAAAAAHKDHGEGVVLGAPGTNPGVAPRGVQAGGPAPWDERQASFYLREMVAAANADLPDPYSAYLARRSEFEGSPHFFLDCSHVLLQLGDRYRGHGIRVLTNVLELGLGDSSLLRVAAYRLLQVSADVFSANEAVAVDGRHSLGARALAQLQGDVRDQARALELAIFTLKEVMLRRPEEPQSYRDLALALADRARLAVWLLLRGLPEEAAAVTGGGSAAKGNDAAADAAAARVVEDLGEAASLLHRVIVERWPPGFEEIEVPAMVDAGGLLRLAEAARSALGESRVRRLRDDVSRLFGEGVDVAGRSIDADLRVTLQWDSGDADLDLVVREPGGEVVTHDNRLSRHGGMMSSDQRRGYGPEQYMTRALRPGVYRLEANVYAIEEGYDGAAGERPGQAAAGGKRSAGDVRRVVGPVGVRTVISTNFGRASQAWHQLTARVSGESVNRVLLLGRVVVSERGAVRVETAGGGPGGLAADGGRDATRTGKGRAAAVEREGLPPLRAVRRFDLPYLRRDGPGGDAGAGAAVADARTARRLWMYTALDVPLWAYALQLALIVAVVLLWLCKFRK